MVLQQGGGGSQGPARHLCTAAGLRAIVTCVCDTCNLVIQSFLRVPFLLQRASGYDPRANPRDHTGWSGTSTRD